MRKAYYLVPVVFILMFTIDVEGQLNRRKIQSMNKKMANFRGKKHDFKNHVYSAIGITVNALNYYGDLSPLPKRISTDISFTRPAFGVTLVHRFGPRYTLLGSFMYGTLKGSDVNSAHQSDLGNGVYRYARNLSFRNRIKELSLVAVFDLFDNQSSYISRVKWTPYVFLGVAAFLHNPQAQAPAKFLDGTPDPYAGQWVDLQPLGTEGQYSKLQPTDANYGIKPYNLLQVAIPFGIGARFRINEVLDLWADIGFRYTFTDYLDDVSRNYTNLNEITAKGETSTTSNRSKLAQAMSYRSNELGVGGITPPNLPNTSVGHYPIGGQYSNLAILNGYGIDDKNHENIRGHKSQPDVYMVTSVKLTYILGATFHRAKFR